MNNPMNMNKSIEDLIYDVRSQLLNIEASMELASIAADTLQADVSALGAFLDLVRPNIGFAADQLEDVCKLIYEDRQNEEKSA